MKAVPLVLAAVIAVAALSSFCTLRWIAARPQPLSADAHEWLHKELNVTPEQRQALAPVEAAYAQKELQFKQQMRAANHELAVLLDRSRAYTPEVAAAVQKIHDHMGEFQQATLRHVFTMRQMLTPAQGDKLTHLAQQALDQAP